MEMLRFRLNGRSGRLAVDYRPNDNIEESGFDMFDPADFDPALAIGYPTLRAWVHDYQGTGYRTASAFVQWIETERRGAAVAYAKQLDTSTVFEDLAMPFFSYGYPATLYDAPAHNMHTAESMTWVATTWFVTMPARWTDHEVRPLCGFRWGYEEDRAGIMTMPLSLLTGDDWTADLDWLRTSCHRFRFADHHSIDDA